MQPSGTTEQRATAAGRRGAKAWTEGEVGQGGWMVGATQKVAVRRAKWHGPDHTWHGLHHTARIVKSPAYRAGRAGRVGPGTLPSRAMTHVQCGRAM
jgi:hypothetical protein